MPLGILILTTGEVISRISSNFTIAFGFSDGIGLRQPQNSYALYGVFYLGLDECIIWIR